MIVNDYNLDTCRKATQDYRTNHGIHEPVENIDGCGVFWRKQAES